MPSTAFVELAVRAGDQVGCGEVGELVLHAPLVLPERGAVQLQVHVQEPDVAGARTFGVYSRPESPQGAAPEHPWTRHASGTLARAGEQVSRGEEFDFAVWPPAGAAAIDVDDLYENLAATGFDYGPVFRGMRAAWQRGDDVYADVALPEGQSTDAEAARFGLHPALLDSALHSLGLGTLRELAAGGVLFSCEGTTLQAVGATALRVRLAGHGARTFSLQAADSSGQPVISIAAMTLRPPATSAAATDAALSAGPQPGRHRPRPPHRRPRSRLLRPGPAARRTVRRTPRPGPDGPGTHPGSGGTGLLRGGGGRTVQVVHGSGLHLPHRCGTAQPDRRRTRHGTPGDAGVRLPDVGLPGPLSGRGTSRRRRRRHHQPYRPDRGQAVRGRQRRPRSPSSAWAAATPAASATPKSCGTWWPRAATASPRSRPTAAGT